MKGENPIITSVHVGKVSDEHSFIIKYCTQGRKVESFSSKTRTKARVPTLLTPIQDSTENP